MDNLTHSLFGLTLARTPLSRAGRGTTAALLLASNAPDADVVVTLGGTANYLAFHRGPSHGPLGVIGLAAVVAGLVWLGNRRWKGTGADPDASYLSLWLISMLGVIGHIGLDLPTSYGTRPLSPFSWTWFTLDWMPIVDIYLLAIFGVTFWLARKAGAGPEGRLRRQQFATIALVLMALNYGVRGLAHTRALAQAPAAFDGRLPEWCAQGVRPGIGLDWWPRRTAAGERDLNAGRCLVELAAMPDFLSPFRWRLVAQLSNAYEVRDVDLIGGTGLSAQEPLPERVLPARVPNQWTPAVLKAATAPTARVFLGFSRFPAARSTEQPDGSTLVQWSDLRFVQGDLDDPRQFRRGLFGATVLVGPDGAIREDRLGP
ncbi:MAG: metal-dependent hydrolase [Vicinamibacterales bacterium]